MHSIIAKNDGLLLYESNDSSYDIDPDMILSYLNEVVVLDKEYTLRTYFEMLDYYKLLQLLEGYTSSYMVEFKKCPKSDCVGDRNINRLELLKLIDISEYEGTQELQISLDFSGVGFPSTDYPFETDSSGEIGYAIEFCKLNELLDIPLVLGQSILTFELAEYKSDRYATSFTLFEFIQGIMGELSFLGSTEDRDNEKQHLHELIAEVKECIANDKTSSFVEIEKVVDIE